MTKDDVLRMLADEYRDKMRLEGDFTLSEFRASMREVGIRLGEKKARSMLDEKVALGELVCLPVISGGHDVTIWRKNVKAKSTHLVSRRPRNTRRATKRSI